jgi:DNA polymerase I
MNRNVFFIGEKALIEDNKYFNTSTKEECLAYLKTKTELGLDIETTYKFEGKYGKMEGLSPYTSNIVMLQIGDLNKQFLIDTRVVSIDFLKGILENESITKVGHNLKFEYLHVLHNNGIRLKNLYDTQIAEQIIYCGLTQSFITIPDKKEKITRFSLEALIYIYFKEKVDKNTRLQFLKIKDKPFTITQILYGVDDIIYPLQIKALQEVKLIKKNLGNTLSLEMLFLEVLGNIEYKGLKLNKDAWKKVYESKLIVFKEYEEILNTFVQNNYATSKFINKQLDLFSKELSCNIMWTSSKQVIEFFMYLNACPQEVSKSTKKLSYTVNATVIASSLLTLNKDQPEDVKKFIKDYLRFKELEQSVTTFGISFFKYINPISNRLHTNFKQIKNTGRISSASPNLQNIPSDKRYRECFIPEEGNIYVNCDYSGQETVLLANISGEANIAHLINTGGCMHCFVTRKVYPELMDLTDTEIKQNHPEKRQLVKKANFAIQYGGTGYTIAKNVGITEKEGDDVYNAYFKAFPTLKQYFTKVQNQTIAQGYVLIDTITNRKSYFIPSKNQKEKFSIMKKALNYPVQGAGGSMTKLASIYFYKWIVKNNYLDKVWIVLTVHDELIIECNIDVQTIVKTALEESMLKAADVWCIDVKMKAEAHISDKWEH